MVRFSLVIVTLVALPSPLALLVDGDRADDTREEIAEAAEEEAAEIEDDDEDEGATSAWSPLSRCCCLTRVTA